MLTLLLLIRSKPAFEQTRFHKLDRSLPLAADTDADDDGAMALSASDLPAMYTLLTNSLSGDENLRKPAEAALSQSENRPGFCSCLMVYIFYSPGFHLVSNLLTRL